MEPDTEFKASSILGRIVQRSKYLMPRSMKNALRSAPAVRSVLRYVKSRDHTALADSYVKQLVNSPYRLAKNYSANGYHNALDFLGPEKFRESLGADLFRFQHMYGRRPLIGPDYGIPDFVFDQKYFGLVPFPTPGDKLSVPHYLPDHVADAVRLPTVVYTSSIPELPSDDAVRPNVYFIKKRAGSGDYLRVQWPPSPAERNRAKAHLERYMQQSYGEVTNEWWYLPVPHEWFMEESVEDKLLETRDFKVWLAGGEVICINVSDLRAEITTTNFYDASLTFMQSTWSNRPNNRKEPPPGGEQMMAIARQIGAKFPFIRVDFLVTADKPFLGELTVCPGNFHESLQNAEIDRQLFLRAIALRNAWYERWCAH